jgi:hypothetical protein
MVGRDVRRLGRVGVHVVQLPLIGVAGTDGPAQHQLPLVAEVSAVADHLDVLIGSCGGCVRPAKCVGERHAVDRRAVVRNPG